MKYQSTYNSYIALQGGIWTIVAIAIFSENAFLDIRSCTCNRGSSGSSKKFTKTIEEHSVTCATLHQTMCVYTWNCITSFLEIIFYKTVTKTVQSMATALLQLHGHGSDFLIMITANTWIKTLRFLMTYRVLILS